MREKECAAADHDLTAACAYRQRRRHRDPRGDREYRICPWVPDPGCAVLARRHNGVPVGTERDGCDRAAMAREERQQPPLRGPDLCRPVRATADDRVAHGIEGHMRHFVGVSHSNADRVTRLRLPDPDGAVVARGCNVFPVAAEPGIRERAAVGAA